MDSMEIQKRVDELSDAMIAKGMREPRAQMTLENHTDARVAFFWKVAGPYGRTETDCNVVSGVDLVDIFRDASAWVAEQPSAEEAKMNDFMKALGGVIDLGNKNGIEVDFLNPLVETMKRLSENALTDGRTRTGDA